MLTTEKIDNTATNHSRKHIFQDLREIIVQTRTLIRSFKQNDENVKNTKAVAAIRNPRVLFAIY